jgi:RNA polymerase sigma-70 factor (ECF subfamily)
VSAPPETALLADTAEDWPTASPRHDDARFGDDEAGDERSSGVGPARLHARAAMDEVFPLVYRQMRSLVGRRPEFDDLVQIAAEQALRSIPSFAGRSKLSTWTYRICYLTMLRHDRWYRRWLRRFTLTDRGEIDTHAPAADEPDFEAMERAARLRRAVERLSPKRRSVVVLHDLEGHSVEDIAVIVAAKPLTVRSRLRDGRRDLAAILAADPYFGDEACSSEETDR